VRLDTPRLLGWPELLDTLLGTVLHASTIRQHASDGHYKPTVHSGINAGYDTVSVTDGAHGVTRQVDPA